MRRVDRSARGLYRSPTIFPIFPIFKNSPEIQWM
nr:MAG TPA: hypothetical protein [Caudoviricetes sp.]